MSHRGEDAGLQGLSSPVPTQQTKKEEVEEMLVEPPANGSGADGQPVEVGLSDLNEEETQVETIL